MDYDNKNWSGNITDPKRNRWGNKNVDFSLLAKYRT